MRRIGFSGSCGPPHRVNQGNSFAPSGTRTASNLRRAAGGFEATPVSGALMRRGAALRSVRSSPACPGCRIRSQRSPDHSQSGPLAVRTTRSPDHSQSGPLAVRATRLDHSQSGPLAVRATRSPGHSQSGPLAVRATRSPGHSQSGPLWPRDLDSTCRHAAPTARAQGEITHAAPTVMPLELS